MFREGRDSRGSPADGLADSRGARFLRQSTARPEGLTGQVTAAALDHPWRFLGGALVITAAAGALASTLEVRSSFDELLPENLPSVAQARTLVERVGGDGTVLLDVEARGDPREAPAAMEAARALAPVLAAQIRALGPEVRHVEWNVSDVAAWYEARWPLFATVEALERARDTIAAEVKRAKRERNPLLDLGGALDADGPPRTAGVPPATATPPVAARTSTGGLATTASTGEVARWLDPAHPLPREEVAARFARNPGGFFVHPDGRSLTIVVRPAGSALSVQDTRALLERIRGIIDGHRAELAAHHLRIGLGGTFPLWLAEYDTILRDVLSSAFLCLALVLGSLVLFYRDLRSTASLGVTIVAAVITTFGVARLGISHLNTQTASLGSIVAGNGINYGLIYLARVNQLRRGGTSFRRAVLDGARTAAQATLLASAASSVAFATLVVAGNRGFRQFGFIGGLGMILSWAFTFALVPALLAAFERLLPLRAPRRPGRSMGSTARAEGPRSALLDHPRAIVAVFAAATALSIVAFVGDLPNMIERNLDNLTNAPSGQSELLRDHARAQAALGQSIAGAVALLPDRQTADAFCAEVERRRQAGAEVAAVVERCDTLSSVLPAHQAEKLAVIHQIVGKLSDLVIDSFPSEQRARLREVRAELAAQAQVGLDAAPPSLVDRFRERDGTVGRLAVVTARRDAHIELAPNLEAFVDAVRGVRVGGVPYDAAGENVILSDLVANMQRSGPLATVLSFLGVCLLVALFLRDAEVTGEVMLVLTVGVVLMAGAGAVAGLKLNFFNFIVFPITFGIAVDYGANVAVRIRDRGGDVRGALREVGGVVALCSWTSIIGYGSICTASNRGLQSFGWYAMLGEATSITAALLLLPALVLTVASWRRRTRAERREAVGRARSNPTT